jgi:hypothetical protein
MKLCQFAPRGVAMADSSRVALTSSKRPKYPARPPTPVCSIARSSFQPPNFEVNLEEVSPMLLAAAGKGIEQTRARRVAGTNRTDFATVAAHEGS